MQRWEGNELAIEERKQKKEVSNEEKEKLMQELFEQLDECAGCPGCCHE